MLLDSYEVVINSGTLEEKRGVAKELRGSIRTLAASNGPCTEVVACGTAVLS